MLRDEVQAPTEESVENIKNITPNIDIPKINGTKIDDGGVVMEDGTVFKNVVVTYTDIGFSPKTITIQKGQAVTFVNQSSGSLWVASDNHPIHTIYPAFDEKASVGKGASWSFAFDKVGSWGYHNHKQSSKTGVVIVQ